MVRTAQGEWRLSAPLCKLVLTAHIVVSVGWLGIVVAKLALGLAAAAAGEPGPAISLYRSMSVIDRFFPPAAIATIATGVLLSLGTKWGLFRYYWVVVKLVLTVAVPATAIPIVDGLVQRSIAASSEPLVPESAILGMAAAPAILIALTGAHALMLGAAAVISVFKPWGKTWLGRRTAARPTTGRRETGLMRLAGG